ncbi:MAG: Inositol 2-dehydrogenase/D-chiro-inositol 3-dehydrogenase [Verrucomicrobiae bacterium]|nr:Inositol 2-dehydrogenase/D-chiro-inositol 3-dehydrogenase [Verrucomicrobiae bacterium]
MKLRIGVTGLGRIGWEHCRGLAEHPDYSLAGVADPVAERRAEAATKFGCAVFATHEELVAAGILDVIVIASPTHLHKAMAVGAFKAGLHVLLEKPMAVTVADARAIAQAAHRVKRILTVYQPHRLMPYHQQIRQLIATGKIGQVYHVKRGAFGWGRRNDWQTLTKFGGGMLNNHGAHFIDQLLDLTGRDVERVFCRLGRVATLGDAEDVVKLVYHTKAGMLGEVEINQASPRPGYELEVYGTHGVLWKEVNTLKLRYFRPEELPPIELETSLASTGRRYPRDSAKFYDEAIPIDPQHAVNAYTDLAQAIRTGGEPYVKPAETLAVMQLMARARRDARRIVATPI